MDGSIMTGGNGNNTYAFSDPNSTGTYLINAFHTDAGQSVVQLAAGVTPGEVTVAQVGNDLKLDWANDPIIIQNYFLGDQYKIASVNFADGTVWSASQLETLAAASDYTTIDLGDKNYATATAGLTGNYKLIAGDGSYDKLNASKGNGDNHLTAGDGNYDTLKVDSGTGNNILIAGDGAYDGLSANSTSGNNQLTVGNGNYATLQVNSSTGNNSLTAGDAAYDTLSANNSQGSNQLTAGDGNYATLQAKLSSGSNTLTAGNGNDNVLTVAGSTGNNILTSGNGAYNSLTGGSGDDILTIGSGNNNTLKGGGGNDIYRFGSAFGMYDTINNAGAGSTPHGEIDFGAGLSDENLWFMRQGSNLVIDELGTNGQITVSNWFGNTGSQVESIHAGGMELDNGQVQQLIQAMASFSAHNAGFSASQAIAMPTDNTLQAAITASWHS
jgi:hypothetical protein